MLFQVPLLGVFLAGFLGSCRTAAFGRPGWACRRSRVATIGQHQTSILPAVAANSNSDNDDFLAAAMTTKSSSHSLPNMIVTCGTTDELVQAIGDYIQPHHQVAEIGSQLRQVSTRICQSCQTATLVDVQRKFPKARLEQPGRTEAMRLPNDDQSFFPHICTFYEIAQLSDWPQVLFPLRQQQSYYDVLVLDVNAIVGNDLEWTSLSMIQQFHAFNNNNDLIVLVKSAGLNQWANRIHSADYWRHYHDKLLQPILVSSSAGSGSFVICTVGVQEYRSTIHVTVQPTDAVLEVGCHYGTTTVLLQEHAAHCMGVDVGRKIVAQAKQRFPHVEFRVGNAWKTGELLRFWHDYYKEHCQMQKGEDEATTKNNGWDVIYVDVGGLSGSDGLLEAIQLVSSLQYALEPRCIVIKSLCMQRLSTRLMSYWLLKKQTQQTSGGDRLAADIMEQDDDEHPK